MEVCNHKGRVVEIGFPSFLTMECDKCNKTITYEGLTVTGYEETVKPNDTVNVTSTIIKRKEL